MNGQHSLPKLLLEVKGDSLHLFTTILQSGVKIKTFHGNTIANFLSNIDGLNYEHLSSILETIFLNGSPVDDLNTPLLSDEPVLALSASMPGLAGAIFRKNSIHSALRTTAPCKQQHKPDKNSIIVTLKLFNTIAKECGKPLLHLGVVTTGTNVLNFLKIRPGILSHASLIQLDNRKIDAELLLLTLRDISTFLLTINKNDG